MDFGMMTYVAALSVSTERVTEFIKRLPAFSNYLSAQKTGAQEDVRIICVRVLAVIIGGVICGLFPKRWFPPELPFPPNSGIRPLIASCLGSWRAAVRASGTAPSTRCATLKTKWAKHEVMGLMIGDLWKALKFATTAQPRRIMKSFSVLETLGRSRRSKLRKQIRG